jgi:hypothetical protein
MDRESHNTASQYRIPGVKHDCLAWRDGLLALHKFDNGCSVINQ